MRLNATFASSIGALTMAAASRPAGAVVVNIDATTAGGDAAHGNAAVLAPGECVGAVFDPTRIDLGPGTCTVADALFTT